MERIAGVECDLLTLFILNRKNQKIGISRRGGMIKGVRVGAGIHLYLVHFSEGIRFHLPGLEMPAAVKDFFGQWMTGGADGGCGTNSFR